MAKEGGFWYRLASGFLIGLAVVIPGVSGGVLAMALGLYEPLIAAIANPFDNWRANLRLFLPLGLGVGGCLLLFSRVLEFLFAQYPLATLYFFMGLVLAGVPGLLKEANAKGFRLTYGAASILALVLLVAFTKAAGPGWVSPLKTGLLSHLFKGVLLGVGLVIPGLSASLLLIAFGFYEELLGAVVQLNLGILVPTALGLVPGIVLVSKAINWLFQWKHSLIHYIILGLMLGSLVAAFPGWPRTLGEWLLCLALFAGGIWLASRFNDKD